MNSAYFRTDYFATVIRNINIPKNQGKMESTDENIDGFKEFYETEMEELDLMSLSRYDSAQDNIREILFRT